MTMPDTFFEQDKPQSQIKAAGLTAKDIVVVVLSTLGKSQKLNNKIDSF